MYELTDINTIKRLMKKHGVKFSKQLGQNFLIDPEVCPRLVGESGVNSECGVLEIGAGVGVLTRELAKRAKTVLSLEIDSGLIPILSDVLSEFDNVTVLNADIMKADLHRLFEDFFKDCNGVYVCANLPYYITSPVIMLLLEGGFDIEAITVMVQKEAGERLCAAPGTRGAGAVSVAVDYRSRARELFFVPRQSFLPEPSVDSEVIRLEPRKEKKYSPIDEKFFFGVVKAAFSQRRKTAANSIASGLGIAKETVISALNAAGLDASVRAERLTTEQLVRLGDELYAVK